jgi:membrane associated rhomboid family serine protease
MGIQNRDYYRNDTASGGGWSGSIGASMCQKIMVVTIVVYLLQILITVPHRYSIPEMIGELGPEEQKILRKMEEQGQTDDLQRFAAQMGGVTYISLIEEWCKLDPVKVSQGQIWRLLTYAFLHDRHGIWHIIFNMFALWMFGTAIEAILGGREFLLFYLISAIFSGVCHVLFAFAMHDSVSAVGASGAVMAVAMLFAIYHPTAPINIYFFFTVEARWLIILYVIWDLHPVLLALSGAQTRGTGIAHAAHLGGLAFGFLYYHFHWSLSGWLPTKGGPTIGQKLTRWWTRPALRVYQTPVERPTARVPPPVSSPVSSRDMERRVDEILKKIKDQGEASLSEEERTLLRDASQAYKRKNS